MVFGEVSSWSYIAEGGCPFRIRRGGWKGEERARSNDGFASTLVSSPDLQQPLENRPGLRPQKTLTSHTPLCVERKGNIYGNRFVKTPNPYFQGIRAKSVPNTMLSMHANTLE